jgi:uncharacterized protein (TIGR03083 family)
MVELNYLAIIRSESQRLWEIFASGDLGAPVPGCEEWSVGDLAVHICSVQSWCTAVVATGQPSDQGFTMSMTDAVKAFPEITEELILELSQHDPNDPCWNFVPAAKTHAFWPRRQALEVAVHRWDGAAALSASPSPIENRLAVDVVDEFVTHLLKRVIDRDQVSPEELEGKLRVKASSEGETWAFGVNDGTFFVSTASSGADAEISGSAHDLALAMFRRPGGATLDVSGDVRLAERWQKVFSL